MKKQRLLIRTVILLVLGAAVVYTLYANFTKDDIQKVAVGKKAPDFVLTDMNGEQHRLSDYEGKGVLLNFWATWCKPCEREMPYMDKQYQENQEEDVQILAVNIGESNVVVNEFIKKHDLTFPILNDKKQEVQTVYGIGNLPITFLIGPDGNVVNVHEGEIINEQVVIDMIKEIKP
ncbi:thiol-disulfide oxidoreductase ResA [Robertmurraya sp. DFI.2.37]|uniref:thiol-disulfide oxidoreductase ResA n=1 Tax=Robertmurraya sp. DFI.2.37 TaxID=3031819 RepID=UPI0012484000|nr:thiol-disulfide oxidoreductase ResA [Robertmurraya sp. DFI.2.37]MDF1507673.1 thiol-disulfide oxidoreductase ResA [Robertmurraya sp. DFI.2.37]